jgi:hypothetical protein
MDGALKTGSSFCYRRAMQHIKFHQRKMLKGKFSGRDTGCFTLNAKFLVSKEGRKGV